ncbi:GHKL domain-containing protein [Lactobacillus sp. S2-2]|uniref:sensor histidine kinase n=1 Tax=Lactobacillus sp. S2-2 TaxID=2692917 RepID=UPI001F3C8D37|nr:HAMP domain-containing sensor histidine kinase [Lactobacillus sp. S2-2]MCF6515204.1 GHKL domain-containing protein [Lactobacillus sp. S2-2]
MQLTGKEKTELFIEGIFTLILLLLLNLAITVLITQSLQTNPGLREGFFTIKQSISFGGARIHLMSWENLFWMAMFVIDTIIIYWRLIRRYHQMQLRHIISELHYIANGHFDHRIPFELEGDTERIVISINSLVDSVIESLRGERSIEKSKDELVSNVSHDLRTPLTSIIGYLGLIENGKYKTEQELLDYVHTAYLKAGQMKSLVDQLFEYTKANQIKEENTDKININQLLEQLETYFELDAKKKGMKIHVQPVQNDVFIRGNAESLGRVFNNLISNAIKYGDGGKNIYISAEVNDESSVIFKVANDGEEIPSSSIKQIFTRFYRVEESRNKETGGSGLGLAIVEGIVNNHGGFINVTSNKKMTTFEIHLPMDPKEPLVKKALKDS